jgi:GntR family transcriptional regulator/MocR family aminotransferase
MLPIQNLLQIDKTLPVPVYLQIANGIVSIIKQGILRPGTLLPSSRKLAELLKIHRKTVIAAYDELLAQSWAETVPRKGLYVSQCLPEIRPRAILPIKLVIDYPATTGFEVAEKKSSYYIPYIARKERLSINEGFPDTRLAPVDLLIREYRRFANYKFTSKFLAYGPSQGSENLRNELSRFLSDTRGLHVPPANILITKGAQMAFYLVSQLLLKNGDRVIVGDPGYLGASEVFENAGADLHFVPVDENGIDTEAVEALCKRKKIRLLYVIPHHHNPTTVTLSSVRRMHLLELARKYQFAILEDDYDYDFQYSSSPILPLASVDHSGQVIYVGSFCKIIAPAVRVGFMVAPENLINQATRLRKIVDRQGEQLLEEAIANMLKNGDITRHLKKTNKIYHERRDLMCGLLEEKLSGKLTFKRPQGGFAIWASYAAGISPALVAEKARQLGLLVPSGEKYYHEKQKRYDEVRMGFASLDEKEIREVVEILVRSM